MLLQIYYITDSPLYQYSLPTISTTTLFVKPTGLSILKHSISFRWPIQIAYSSYLYGPLFICDCLPSLFLSFLLFYRYFVNPALKASFRAYNTASEEIHIDAELPAHRNGSAGMTEEPGGNTGFFLMLVQDHAHY